MYFTKEETSLCKQIAKKHRKEINYGDWYYTTEFPEEKYRARIYKYRWTGMADRAINKRKEIIPLWTISDCLEFLYQKEVPLVIDTRYDPWAVKRGWKWHLWWGEPKDNVKPWGGSLNAKTPLEACLKAVLAVLEEGK